jgi:hypothetical protein
LLGVGKNLRRIVISSPLKDWQTSAVKSSSTGIFFVGRIFDTDSISLFVIDIFKVFVLFGFL